MAMRSSYRIGAAIAMTAMGISAGAVPAVADAGQRGTAVPGGAQVWVQRFGGPFISATASSEATNPSGTVVYVTGITTKKATGLRDEVTVAYNAATGRQLWLARYQGTGRHPRGSAGVPAITVSPDGATVYVAGDLARGAHNDYLVLAYNAATGAQRWAVTPLAFASVAQYQAVAVSPDSKTVYVTGTQDFAGSAAFKSYDTIALSAATGATVWDTKEQFPAARGPRPHVHRGEPGRVEGVHRRIERDRRLNPATGDAALAGRLQAGLRPAARSRWRSARTPRPCTSPAAACPRQRARTTGRPPSSPPPAPRCGRPPTTARDLKRDGQHRHRAAPDGSAVYVTGSAGQASGLNEYATIGYDAATGHQLWQASYRTTRATDNAAGLAVSADGSTVYVTGTSIASYGTPADYATAAYGATSGAQLWSARYTVTGAQDNAAGVVVSGGNAVVTGTSGPYGGQSDFATVAYQG